MDDARPRQGESTRRDRPRHPAAGASRRAGPGRGATPVPFRGGGFRPSGNRWAAVAILVAVVVVLEAGLRAGWVSPLTLPRPSAVLGTFVELWETGGLWRHLGPSLSRLAVGGALGAALGVAVGMAIGLFGAVRAGLVPVVAALFPIPKIALLPLFVIWFGIGEPSKWALIAFGTFTPTVVATFGAVDGVDRGLIRMGQSFGLPWWSIVRKIVLPGAMPGILSGLRISLSIAIILLVAAEMLGAQHGIGAYILEAGSLYDLERLFAGVVVLSALGVGLSAAMTAIERRVLRWR